MVVQATKKEKKKLLEKGHCRQNKTQKTRQAHEKTNRVFRQVAPGLLWKVIENSMPIRIQFTEGKSKWLDKLNEIRLKINWIENLEKNEKQTTGNIVLYVSTHLMARQKYSDEQIDFISDQLDTTENTKGEITEEFIKAFPQSGWKIENIKQKLPRWPWKRASIWRIASTVKCKAS